MNLGDNFVQEGLANRITPFTTNRPGASNFDSEKTYYNVMNRFKWGGIDKPGVYVDETVKRMCVTHRLMLNTLASHLIAEHKFDKARKVMKLSEEKIPAFNVPVTYLNGGMEMANNYLLLGDKKKASETLTTIWNNCEQYANYYLSLSTSNFSLSEIDAMRQFMMMQGIIQGMRSIDVKKAASWEKTLSMLYSGYLQKGGRPMQYGDE